MQMYEHTILSNPANNFKKTPPENQVAFANETFRSSYNLGFLGVTDSLEEVKKGRYAFL